MAEQLHYRNLAVPFLSQRKNTYVFKGKYEDDTMDFDMGEWHHNDDHLHYDGKNGDVEVSMANRSCNITCAAMLLHYFGITPDTPDTMMRNYFTSLGDFATLDDREDSRYTYKSVMALQVWDTMKQFVKIKYGSQYTPELYLKNTCTIQILRDNIAAGYPVMISIGIEVGESGGHIAVVRGFTKIGNDEYIILNDPWGSPADIDNELALGKDASFYSYYSTWAGNNGSNGDNVVLKVTEFRKMIAKNGTINVAMVIRASLWQNPNDKEKSGTDAVFPMNADFMWHSGIHLSIQKEICSIGAGRLLAVRNSDAINGSASFLLVKHQYAKLEGTNAGNKIGKILPFYALYMHTDSINIEDCAKTYFKYGRLPPQYNFKWLLQLFSNMLPHVYVIANVDTTKEIIDTTTDGQMNATYKAQEIYNAEIVTGDFGLIKTDDSSGEFHGRRMLVHLLPVNSLFRELLDPENYAKSSFQRRMLDPSNFIKQVGIGENAPKYIFFHSYDATSTVTTESTESEIFCSKFYDVDGLDDNKFFQKPITVNGKVFKRNAIKLSQLYKNEVVSFDDLVNLPVPRHIGLAPITYLNGKAHNLAFVGATTVTGFLSLSGTDFRTEQKAHWKKIFGYRKTDNLNTLAMTDNFFAGIEDISLDLVLLYKDSKDSNSSIYNRLNEYFKKYHLARCGELSLFLNNPESDADDNLNVFFGTWRYHLRTTLNYCFYIITKLLKKDDYKPPFVNVNVTDDTGDGDDIANFFVDRLEEFYLPLGFAEIAIEMACCRLCNIPQNKIATTPNTPDTRFKTGDRSIGKLLERYSALLTATFNSFNMSHQHYVDTVIEISKNDIIGKSGRYNNEENMIHFEIFSPQDCNIYTELGIETKGSIVDQQKGRFFDPAHIVEILKEHIPEEDKIDFGFRYLEKNIILYSEFLKLNGSGIFSTYTFKHISEWSQTLTFDKFLENHSSTLPLNAYVRTDEKVMPFHVETTDEQTDTPVVFKDKDYGVEEYFKECAVPYHWSLEKILGKFLFTNGFYIYYNPTYFLEQLIKKDKESLDHHKSLISSDPTADT